MEKRIVTILCGGCFNKLHLGHEYFLKRSKSFGTRLIIVLCNDKNNNKEHAVPVKIRKQNLAKLKIADEISIGYKDRWERVLDKFKPDIVTLGYDQTLKKEFIENIKKRGIKIIKIKKLGDFRSSGMF
ncbi:MAG: adenylyltransferase/cytidyltransferase family protein [Candidatus Aenigmatarchaeota archaeon]